MRPGCISNPTDAAVSEQRLDKPEYKCKRDPAIAIVNTPDFLPLSTARLVLRRFVDADIDTFLSYRNDPEVFRYQNGTGCTPAEAAKFITRHHRLEALVPGEWIQIAIAFRANDELIGDCGVRVHAADSRQATVGVTLMRAQHGRGFATEALSCLFEYLFRQRAFDRLVVDTDAENTAMQCLAERLGMRREAHFRQSLWFKGRWADEMFYAILRDEWFARSESQ